MPRPTAARMFYMVVGFTLGALGLVLFQLLVLPGIISSMPFLATPTPLPPPVTSRFTGTALERVLAIDQTRESSGVTIRVTSAEMFSDGVTVSYVVTSGRVAAPSTWEPEAFLLTDDLGTVYQVSAPGTSASLSSGLSLGKVTFVPPPPARARTIQLQIPHLLNAAFRLPEGQARVLVGPWTFAVHISP
ncbi:MAG: hypothetical protein FJ033_10840 [Chloroflexi bacterium]|nr:hypothetical protein [Chloroflexota bacterium]